MKQLKLDVKPLDPISMPGKETSIQVCVKDFQEKPIQNAQVLLIVVDDAGKYKNILFLI